MEHLSLFELNKLIGNALSKTLEPSYWVIAEIAELRNHNNGHCYLELVEKADQQIRAKMKATIWASNYTVISSRFTSVTGQNLKAGMKILFNAMVQFHEVYGLSITIRDIDAQFTLGERARKRQEIIDKLRTEGVFDMNRELAMPTVPQRIAVISSESAAGYGDFINQLQHNDGGYTFFITLFPALMQGDKADLSIISAMHQVFERAEEFDVLVIIRGGGAALDLDCFDSYDLCSHVAQFSLPVITGIGHERDETVSDLVANTKLKTPTAVAVFLIEALNTFEYGLDQHFLTLSRMLQEALDDSSMVLEQHSNRIYRSTRFQIGASDLTLAGFSKLLAAGWKNTLKAGNLRLDTLKSTMIKQPLKIVDVQSKLLLLLEKELVVVSPENVLKRGYSITKINGKNVNKLHEIPANSTAVTISDEFEITSIVEYAKRR